jgi:hypothetical protein
MRKRCALYTHLHTTPCFVLDAEWLQQRLPCRGWTGMRRGAVIAPQHLHLCAPSTLSAPPGAVYWVRDAFLRAILERA